MAEGLDNLANPRKAFGVRNVRAVPSEEEIDGVDASRALCSHSVRVTVAKKEVLPFYPNWLGHSKVRMVANGEEAVPSAGWR
jgi:hypothetical protein